MLQTVHGFSRVQILGLWISVVFFSTGFADSLPIFAILRNEEVSLMSQRSCSPGGVFGRLCGDMTYGSMTSAAAAVPSEFRQLTFL